MNQFYAVVSSNIDFFKNRDVDYLCKFLNFTNVENDLIIECIDGYVRCEYDNAAGYWRYPVIWK